MRRCYCPECGQVVLASETPGGEWRALGHYVPDPDGGYTERRLYGNVRIRVPEKICPGSDQPAPEEAP